MDFAAFYRAALRAAGPRLAEAAAGLSETGAAEDADLVAPLVEHPRPRVRAAALRALARLRGDAAVPTLLRAVGDASPRVSRAAADALLPRVALADEQELAGWMNGLHPRHVRLSALRLLAARSKWDGLTWILLECASEDAVNRHVAMGHLRRWMQRFNRTFTQPTRKQKHLVHLALVASAPVLDAKTVATLRFYAGLPADGTPPPE